MVSHRLDPRSAPGRSSTRHVARHARRLVSNHLRGDVRRCADPLVTAALLSQAAEQVELTQDGEQLSVPVDEGDELAAARQDVQALLHIVVAEPDKDALAIGEPAWEDYTWNLGTPRRLEAESRGLTQFLVPNDQMRPASAPDREARRDLYWAMTQRTEEQERRRQAPGGLGGVPNKGAGFGVIAGSPPSIREYIDE